MVHQTVVPPYLLDSIAARGVARFPRAADAARSCRPADDAYRTLRSSPLGAAPTIPSDAGAEAGERAVAATGLTRSIHDAQNKEVLPGRLVRGEGEAPVSDEAVNEAYDGLGAAYRLFSDVFGQNSLDDRGMPLVASAHYSRDYDNAFFDGKQMVFGDGDGEVFTGFTGSLSIIGHELSHGIISHTANLDYQGQPGALNEHCADVFGALTEQYEAKQSADSATWLIGAGIFTPEVTGRALRDMLRPGTAYDDDVLGKDPQPASMDGYVTTESDNGGVHLNSGIPNRAFALAATRLGGPAWEGVGQVWFGVISGSQITTTTDFAGFAALTIAEAATRFGSDSDVRRAIVEGWSTVGVTATSSDSTDVAAEPEGRPREHGSW